MEVDRESSTEHGTGSSLKNLLANGQYVVDPEAVAEAIIRRGSRGGSSVLVPAQLFDDLPASADEGEAAPGAHLA